MCCSLADDEMEEDMFKIGDYVAHYKEGVCQVVDIGKISLSCSDNEKEYYTLKPIYDKDGTVYTPVENKKNQIREVITKQEAETLIAQLGDIEQLTVTDEKKREGLYKEAMLKNQCREWIVIIKTSYERKMERLSRGKKVTHVDDRYLGIAEKFLCGELAVALEMSREEVKGYLSSQMKGA